MHFTDVQIGIAGTAYLAGAVVGALFFGRLTDKFGRKKLFMITLGVYLIATIATAFSFNFVWFIIFRILTGSKNDVSSLSQTLDARLLTYGGSGVSV